MMNRYDMASRRTPKRYPGHVLRKLRAERGVGRPPHKMRSDLHSHAADTIPYALAGGLDKTVFAPSEEVQLM
ncbi:MAG: hypothetical protein GVY11_04005, partial [Gammaproteobacteria bacterium]|nr:hypothetical protein [Gammaproteobacteria bacterium]